MEWTREWTKVPGLEFEQIIYEKRYSDMGGVARITMTNLNPKGLSLNTLKMQREIISALRDARLDNSVGVVVLTGAGDRSFSAGGDVNEERTGGSQEAFEETPDNASHLRLVGKPVIAAVKGYCIAWGNWMAYHCDFTIAADNAIFGQAGPKIGSPSGGAIASYLTRVVGAKKAREMRMLCRRYNAQEALQMGLVNTVVPLDKLDEEVDKWCQELLAMNPTCLKIMKASFDSEIEHMSHGASYFVNLINPEFFGGEEQHEAMRAFLDKRKPDWGKLVRGRPEGFKEEDS